MRLREVLRRLETLPHDAAVRCGDEPIGGLHPARYDDNHLALGTFVIALPFTVADVFAAARGVPEGLNAPVWVGEHPERAIDDIALRDGIVQIDAIDISDYI